MSTRMAIERAAKNIEDSMGVRTTDSRPKLSPMPRAKDVGRKPSRNFGTISTDQVEPDPDQPRQHFDQTALDELAESVAKKGQLQPIRVRWSQSSEKWIIIAGERRWRAAKIAGLKSVACYFHDGMLTPTEILEEQVIENIHRRSLMPLEEANAYKTLMDTKGCNGKQIAESLGVHPAKISRAIALLKLPKDIQTNIEKNELSARTAYEISKLKSDIEKRQAANIAVRQNLSDRQIAKMVRKGRRIRARRKTGVSLEFRTSVGWGVVVSKATQGSYLEIREALSEAMEEVELRINNNVQLY